MWSKREEKKCERRRSRQIKCEEGRKVKSSEKDEKIVKKGNGKSGRKK